MTDSQQTSGHSSPAAHLGSAICSSLGCLTWISLIPVLDACDQGEQLARYFAALFNLIILGAAGGPATLLLMTGFLIARRIDPTPLSQFTKIISMSGMSIALVVLLLKVPLALTILT